MPTPVCQQHVSAGKGSFQFCPEPWTTLKRPAPLYLTHMWRLWYQLTLEAGQTK